MYAFMFKHMFVFSKMCMCAYGVCVCVAATTSRIQGGGTAFTCTYQLSRWFRGMNGSVVNAAHTGAVCCFSPARVLGFLGVKA